jgi:thiamine biosynthesis lipoprotein
MTGPHPAEGTAAVEVAVDFHAMASPCCLRLVGADETRLHAAAAAAVAEVRRIEAAYSRYRPDSVVGRLNALAGRGEPLDVDDEMLALLDFAGQLYTLSDGRFDATAGVLRRAWDFRAARVPSADEVSSILPLVGWPMVRRAGRRVELERAGMELDFGGFGKEYAADRAAALLLSAGVAGGFVDLGGDLRLLGPRADGGPWRLGIRHPRETHALLAEVDLSRGALATSGDYERFFEAGGRRYAHVLDARSGWPVTHWRSVSVVAPTCAAAGAVCTLAMLAGEAAPEFLHAQGVPWLAMDAAGQVLGTLRAVGGAPEA